MYQTINENLSAAVRAQLRSSIAKFTSQHAVTKNSFPMGAGANREKGQLAGLEIPYKRGVVHGESALDPYNGVTSFETMYAPTTAKMYAGLTFTGFTVQFEHFHQKDAMNGNLPENANDMRDQALITYLQHHNWYRIGKNTGSLAVVSVGGGSGSITFTNDATARGRSKGSLRLAISDFTAVGKRVLYESYTESTDTKTATFYLTAKASATTGTVVITDGGTIVAGDVIVKKGHYKKVPYGLGYFQSATGRLMQGANTSVDGFLNARAVSGGSALVTPTAMDTAKGALQTRKNDVDARKRLICHLTIGNYKQLAAYGYNLRTYNAEKGDADTTFNLPVNYKDEDTEFIQDADYEDGYIDLRDRVSFFEYRQSQMDEVSEGPTQYVGTNSVGSTEKYRNWGEAYQFVWDGRGDDGKHKAGHGGPNCGVFIESLTIPNLNQVAEGQSLV